MFQSSDDMLSNLRGAEEGFGLLRKNHAVLEIVCIRIISRIGLPPAKVTARVPAPAEKAISIIPATPVTAVVATTIPVLTYIVASVTSTTAAGGRGGA